MKSTTFSALALVALGLGLPVLADSTGDDAVENPYANFDPDGVPLSVLQNSKSRDASSVSSQSQVTKESRSRNWLLYEYEKQVHTRDAASSDKISSSNLYLQLSMDKNLSKLAGIQNFEMEKPSEKVAPRTGAPTVSGQGSTALRPESGVSAGGFKPLIVPLSSPGVTTLQNFSAQPFALAPAFSGARSPWAAGGDAPASAPSSPSTPSSDSLDVTTPGMIAAKGDPLAGMPDLTLDQLPGESQEQARSRQSAHNDMQLPELTDLDQMRRTQTAQNQPVGPTQAKLATTAKAAPAPAKPVEAKPEDQPLQPDKGAQISPVHPAIANPFDILNR